MLNAACVAHDVLGCREETSLDPPLISVTREVRQADCHELRRSFRLDGLSEYKGCLRREILPK